MDINDMQPWDVRYTGHSTSAGNRNMQQSRGHRPPHGADHSPPPRVNTEIGVLHSSAQTRQDNHRLTHIIRCIEVSSAERQALTLWAGGQQLFSRQPFYIRIILSNNTKSNRSKKIKKYLIVRGSCPKIKDRALIRSASHSKHCPSRDTRVTLDH